MESDRKLDARHAVEEAMTEALMRKCPKCSKPFVKEHGCNKMMCPHCHTMSCYICRQLITGYDHFNQKPGAGPSSPKKSGKCPLWDTNLDQRHHDEVAAAAKVALEQQREAQPDIEEAALKVDLPPPPPQPAVPAGGMPHVHAHHIHAQYRYHPYPQAGLAHPMAPAFGLRAPEGHAVQVHQHAGGGVHVHIHNHVAHGGAPAVDAGLAARADAVLDWAREMHAAQIAVARPPRAHRQPGPAPAVAAAAPAPAQEEPQAARMTRAQARQQVAAGRRRARG